uniref:Uncharacterized protein n=1 Tax=Anopheles albimanus TaxID=7167 RepID=A0A182FY56_ANOAL
MQEGCPSSSASSSRYSESSARLDRARVPQREGFFSRAGGDSRTCGSRLLCQRQPTKPA